jgi:hypothetical protein
MAHPGRVLPKGLTQAGQGSWRSHQQAQDSQTARVSQDFQFF